MISTSELLNDFLENELSYFFIDIYVIQSYKRNSNFSYILIKANEMNACNGKQIGHENWHRKWTFRKSNHEDAFRHMSLSKFFIQKNSLQLV